MLWKLQTNDEFMGEYEKLKLFQVGGGLWHSSSFAIKNYPK
jgi:hypothetical protein